MMTLHVSKLKNNKVSFNKIENMSETHKTNQEVINQFLSGQDPMEKIIAMECSYNDDEVSIIFNNAKGEKRVRMEAFKPFVWAKNSVAVRMFGGDRKTLKKKMVEWGIGVKALTTTFDKNYTAERLENGYKYIFYAKRKMSYQKFMMFFQQAGTPIYPKANKNIKEPIQSPREFLAVAPVEQYMISSGRRLFKGVENYDELKRLQFDLETQGLNPEIHAIDQIGIRTNKGFEKIITITGEGEERKINELTAIVEFLSILSEEKPDIIAGHNSENFDWNFIIVRCEKLGTSLEELSLKFFKHPIYKKNKETILKLGGEVEYYKPTIMWGYNILDSLHAVRRAQAIDSSMKKASLKYVTKYLKQTKDNRVYVPGDKIGSIWLETAPNYAFNDTDGTWYKITEKNPLKAGYESKSGRYIVERYLMDDLWETDKVELRLNESNFLVAKMLPTTFQRACTMGTAAIWKLILLAWCYEHDLAVPAYAPSQRFTGGLSRLLRVGYADRVVKLDYNSLYPSITLTWNIATKLDISNSMLLILDYILTERERYKNLKAECGSKAKKLKKQLENGEIAEEHIAEVKEQIKYWEAEASANDKKQLPLKILANSFFGSYGAPNVFPMGDVSCAEKVTCIGRQSLRLMISHFTNIGYVPIVGDSVTDDTPLFIKYNNSNLIDIKPISELVDEKQVQRDVLGREYDYSKKPYQVLCRSGWCDVEYVYRHDTKKTIYTVSEGDMSVDVTEDHSLFNENKEEIKPKDITKETKLEYYDDNLVFDSITNSNKKLKITAMMVANGTIDRLPINILNCTKTNAEYFLSVFKEYYKGCELSKTCQAGLLFLKNKK